MSQSSQPLRQLLIAFFAAVWIHVGLILLVVLLLVFEVLAAKEIEEVPEEEEEAETFSEILLSFEEDQEIQPETTSDPTEEEPSPDTQKEGEKIARSQASQASQPPKDSNIVGELDTSATSDEGAMAGEDESPALSGAEKETKDNQTFDSEYSDGKKVGPRAQEKDFLMSDLGKEQKSDDSPDEPEKAMAPTKDLISEMEQADFVDIEGVIKTIEDAVGEKDKEKDTAIDEKPEITVVQKKKAASRDGGFSSSTEKTKVRGVLSAKGIGSLDMKSSAVGAYGSHIFREVEREWNIGNFKYRSLIAPGQITLYFVVDQKGHVSRQSRLEMRGASGTQWGIVLNSITAAKIPPMSKKVIEELGGEDLELTIDFTYH